MGDKETGKLFRHYIVYRLFTCVGFLVRRLPNHIALSLGEYLATGVYHLIKKRREITISNLQLAFGSHKSQRELKLIAVQSYRNQGKSLVEFLRFPLLTKEKLWHLVTVRGKENLKRALETSGNAIIFIPHLGNHELLALAYGLLHPKSSALAFPLKNPYLNKITNEYRSRFGLGLIRKRQAIRPVLKALKSGGAVGFLADQDAGKQGVFVEFFGRPASCARGPVAIALKTGAPILFSLIIRQPDDRHLVIISEPVKLDSTGDLDRDIAHNMAKLMAGVESYIRQYPDQWLWQHNRWKTQPDEEWQKKRSQRRSYVKVVGKKE